jgi:hypothetical protein
MRDESMFTKEMQAALEADGEKLRQLTGEDHGPHFLPDRRTIECPYCGGDGGHEVLTHYNPVNGDPLGYWQTCGACEGKKEIEIEVEPVTIDDLTDQ